jgi:hypothetical protein
MEEEKTGENYDLFLEGNLLFCHLTNRNEKATFDDVAFQKVLIILSAKCSWQSWRRKNFLTCVINDVANITNIPDCFLFANTALVFLELTRVNYS